MTRAGNRSGASALAWRSAISGSGAFLLALLVFLGIGASRLWPRISGQQLPFSLIWPFARPLLAVALELSFLVCVPLALGIVASTKGARARPLTWRDALVSSALLVCCLGGLAFALSASLDGGTSTPGALATELVASARQSCVESKAPAEVSVPLVGFSWRCEASRAPRLQGKAPLGKNAQFDAQTVELSDDLRRVSLSDMALAFTTPLVPVQLHAKAATLRGLPPWGRSRRMPFALRACLFLSSAWLAGFGTALLVARASWLPLWGGLIAGALIAACSWLAFSWLERQDPGPLVAWVLPLAVLGAIGVEAGAFFAGPRVWQLWRNRSHTPAIPKNPQ